MTDDAQKVQKSNEVKAKVEKLNADDVFKNSILPIFFSELIMYFIQVMSLFQQFRFEEFVQNAVVMEPLIYVSSEIFPQIFVQYMIYVMMQRREIKDEDGIHSLVIISYLCSFVGFIFSIVVVVPIALQFKYPPQFKITFWTRLILQPFFNVTIASDYYICILQKRFGVVMCKRSLPYILGYAIESMLYAFNEPKWNWPTMVGIIVGQLFGTVWSLMIKFQVKFMKVELQEQPSYYVLDDKVKETVKLPGFKADIKRYMVRNITGPGLFSIVPFITAFASKKCYTTQDFCELFNQYVLGGFMNLSCRVMIDSMQPVAGLLMINHQIKQLTGIMAKLFLYMIVYVGIIVVIFGILFKPQILFAYDVFKELSLLSFYLCIVTSLLNILFGIVVVYCIILEQIPLLILVSLARIIMYFIAIDERPYMKVFFADIAGSIVSLFILGVNIKQVIDISKKQVKKKAKDKMPYLLDMATEDDK